MRKYNLTEFSNLISNERNRKFHFTTINQKCSSSNLKLFCSFQNVIVSLAPNTVVLSNAFDKIALTRVKYINMEHDEIFGCNIYHVVCGDKHSSLNDEVFTITSE